MSKVKNVLKTMHDAGWVLKVDEEKKEGKKGPKKKQAPHGVMYVNPNTQQTTTIGKHYRNGVIPFGTLSKIKKQTGLKF